MTSRMYKNNDGEKEIYNIWYITKVCQLTEVGRLPENENKLEQIMVRKIEAI